MKKKNNAVKTDPELLRQLETAAAGQELIQAVFTLRLPTQRAVAPERVEKLTNEVLERVAIDVGPAEKVNIFRNLGAFSIAARSPVIRALLKEPEIASAVANQQPHAMQITPRNKKPLPKS